MFCTRRDAARRMPWSELRCNCLGRAAAEDEWFGDKSEDSKNGAGGAGKLARDEVVPGHSRCSAGEERGQPGPIPKNGRWGFGRM